VDRPEAWRQHVTDALIETVLARDVLQLQPVAKPALLRHLFVLSTAFPAQILSYNKMLGQLQDAGNTTTLAHYLKLLETAFLVSGLELFARGLQPKRGSSPKLVLWNQALINALASRPFETARLDPEWWGRLIENAVGAHLLNHLVTPEWKIMYWRRGGAEVDYVVERGRTVWGLEVKSGRRRPASGFAAFRRAYPKAHALIIGSEGVPVEEFLAADPRPLLEGG
jgi:predicted AAA+ superfamily ATPase